MLVFLGDTIFHSWEKEMFEKYFGKYKATNLGKPGHSSEDTLNFIESTQFYNMKPELVVLLTGTGDSDRGITTAETIKNIILIIDYILSVSPNSKILLIGPLPRGNPSTEVHRVFNREVNKKLNVIKFHFNVYYTDIGEQFLDNNGLISPKVMRDLLHLTSSGYRILSDSISDFTTVLLGMPS